MLGAHRIQEQGNAREVGLGVLDGEPFQQGTRHHGGMLLQGRVEFGGREQRLRSPAGVKGRGKDGEGKQFFHGRCWGGVSG